MNPELEKYLIELSNFSKINNIDIFIIGGVLRDTLLNIQSDLKDIDLVIDYSFKEFTTKYNAHFNSNLNIREKFLTASISPLPKINIDFVRARSETYPIKGGLPKVIAGDFKTDYLRRDFTINTLRIELKDYLNNKGNLLNYVICEEIALKDLENFKIRILHKDSFTDDPTRIFRAIKYKNKINGSLESNTESLLISALEKKSLTTISNYRILTEFIKILIEPPFSESIKDIIDYKIDIPFFNIEKLVKLSDVLTKKQNKKFLKEDILESFSYILDKENLNLCLLDLNLKKSLRNKILNRI